MPLTFAQIRKFALEAMGGAEAAQEEVWDHISEGYRRVTIHPAVEVPQLSSIEEITVTAGLDKVLRSVTATDAFAVQSIFNKTSGYPLYPDPGGMIGRERYLQTTGTPPSGSVTNYTLDGNYIYVRNVPTVDTVLRIRSIIQVEPITESNVNDNPITPPQYDWAIVYAATANFYRIHPRYAASNADGSPGPNLADQYDAQMNSVLAVTKPVEREQDRVRREVFTLAGYRAAPRSNWSRRGRM